MTEPQPTAISGTMPDVVGMTLEAAETAINNAADGGTPRYTVTYVSGGLGGTVKSTHPGAGKPITDRVTIVVYNWTP